LDLCQNQQPFEAGISKARNSNQSFKGDPILVLSLCNQPITGYPIIENVVEEQAGAIFLLDIGLVGSAVATMADPDRNQRIVFRHIQMLLRDAGEDELGIPAHNVEYLALACR